MDPPSVGYARRTGVASIGLGSGKRSGTRVSLLCYALSLINRTGKASTVLVVGDE